MSPAEHTPSPHPIAAPWLVAAVLATASAVAWALPPQETRTNFYATSAKTRVVGSLTLQCNGRELRRGLETDHATTHTVRRCTRPVIPDPQVPCEMRPGGCANLPGG